MSWLDRHSLRVVQADHFTSIVRPERFGEQHKVEKIRFSVRIGKLGVKRELPSRTLVNPRHGESDSKLVGTHQGERRHREDLPDRETDIMKGRD